VRTPYAYQQDGILHATRHEAGAALLAEPGLGKTLMAIRAALRVGAKRIAVVCPLTVVSVWEDELRAEGQTFLIPEGTRQEKADAISGDGWVVLNYDALVGEPAVLKALLKWDPDMVVLDEAHKIKNPNAKRSKAVHKLTAGRRTLAMTGTPVLRDLLDLYSLYKAIDPDIWGGLTFSQWKMKYARFGGYMGKEVVGFNHVWDIVTRTDPYTFRARKADHLDLPPRRDQHYHYHLKGAEWETYRHLATTGVDEAREWYTGNPLELALRLSQLLSEFKVNATVDRIEELTDAGQPVVVFYRFRKSGDRILQEAGARGIPAYLINGSIPGPTRGQIVQRFQDGARPVLIGQLQATSTGITLTRASEVIYHDLDFSYEHMEQSRDRVYRIGQTESVRYQYMVATGPNGGKTVDGLVLDALDRKADFSAIIMERPNLLTEEL
jgi:SNF2 family DNA or RNA helicase